jgi:type VI secretion system protein ImpF
MRPALPADRRHPPRVQLPLLDRLIDEAPDKRQETAASAAEMMAALRHSVRRDLEALLNARRRWRSWPAGYDELKVSPIGYGIPDYAAGAFNDPARRENLRAEIEATIRSFEPRFATLKVTLIPNQNKLEPSLRLRIDAMLRAEPAPEPVSFDTVVDATTLDVTVRSRSANV